jgi:ABC-type nitrate/sulfonate/bicarbonate transport system substrate-binding protein
VKVVALLSFLISFPFISPSFAADRIRIGYSGLSPATAMLWVTQEGKLFERNGLNPEVLFLRNNLGQSAMIAGEIDMCSYSASLLAPARVQGADLVMIVSFQQKAQLSPCSPAGNSHARRAQGEGSGRDALWHGERRHHAAVAE